MSFNNAHFYISEPKGFLHVAGIPENQVHHLEHHSTEPDNKNEESKLVFGIIQSRSTLQPHFWSISRFHFFRSTAFSVLFMLIISCGNWGWESIETDNEEQLNVFGLISLDDSLESFIIVHKTLDTAGPDEVIVGVDTIYFQIWERYNEDTGLMEPDTFWYNPPLVRTVSESRYFVKDAQVIVSDGLQDYVFERSPLEQTNGDYYGYNDVFNDSAIYLNIDQSFVAQPNTNYSLSVRTPNGLELRGSVTTPGIPTIREDVLPDTLSMKKLFQVTWNSSGDNYATISTGQLGYNWENYVCGTEQFGIIEPGDTSWFSSIESWCYEDNPDSEVTTLIKIRLRLLDENYYKYFLATDSDVANISNFLIGTGGIGAAYGVEGGFGVFGSVSADWTQRVAIP